MTAAAESHTTTESHTTAEHDNAHFNALVLANLDELCAFYHDVIVNGKNGAGWVEGVYPSKRMLKEAILRGEMFAARAADGSIAAAVRVNASCNEGYEGAPWQVDCAPGEFLVPHILATAPAHRHEGWGRAATRFVVDEAREQGLKAVRLDVLTGNQAAEQLYLSEGFHYVTTTCMFYEDTGWVDYLLFELSLVEGENDRQDEGVGAFRPRSRIHQGYEGRPKASGGNGPGGGYTPEMMDLAYQITHPEGDPNTNFRRLGFGGSHLG